MTNFLPSKKTVSVVVAMGAIILYIWLLTWAGPVRAGPGFGAVVLAPTTQAEPAQIFRRGRPPVYPYAYRRGPNGWSYYFGFVPYEKGDYETQALQRVYPEANYPPSMRYWTPKSQ
ncbi:MAG: hypothetical protein ACREDO_02640 [Methyloceanibacter sp.]